jgi:hypothetical protein
VQKLPRCHVQLGHGRQRLDITQTHLRKKLNGPLTLGDLAQGAQSISMLAPKRQVLCHREVRRNHWFLGNQTNTHPFR